MGKIATAISRTQDHFEAALHILDEDEKLNPKRSPDCASLNWNAILKGASRFANATAVKAKRNEVGQTSRHQKQPWEQFRQSARAFAGMDRLRTAPADLSRAGCRSLFS